MRNSDFGIKNKRLKTEKEHRGQRTEDRNQESEVSPAAGRRNGQFDQRENFFRTCKKV
jgi:hypothetical protein